MSENNNISTLEEVYDIINNNLISKGELEKQSEVIKRYNGDDWKDYVSFSDIRYKKNLVKKGDNIEIYVICWKKNQKSGIHNHPDGGCLLKVLSGEIKEDCYCIKQDCCPIYTLTKTLKKDDIGYQIGKNGLHTISVIDDTVTLHIYAPPNHKTLFY
ncbi:MAG: I cysteine dioxygenase [Edafosvirus sp.]|uniref:I cysteine dioxygenase n=1 Tax=Edafosvirus sp. TaxID=2487765 RepID=A0A3G4ZU78_9VIRU|nr:MAG: I cysteine dioxygenase [Edafosvirus sp.]